MWHERQFPWLKYTWGLSYHPLLEPEVCALLLCRDTTPRQVELT